MMPIWLRNLALCILGTLLSGGVGWSATTTIAHGERIAVVETTLDRDAAARVEFARAVERLGESVEAARLERLSTQVPTARLGVMLEAAVERLQAAGECR